MKKILWKFVSYLFQKEIASHVESFRRTHFIQEEKKQDQRRVKVNYPIGTKVIIRSNEPDDLLIGLVVEHVLHENSGSLYLKIKEESTGNFYCPLDNEPPYWTEDREKALRKLNWAEQWNVLCKYADIDLEHQAYKESAEYKNRNQ